MTISDSNLLKITTSEIQDTDNSMRQKALQCDQKTRIQTFQSVQFSSVEFMLSTAVVVSAQ